MLMTRWPEGLTITHLWRWMTSWFPPWMLGYAVLFIVMLVAGSIAIRVTPAPWQFFVSAYWVLLCFGFMISAVFQWRVWVVLMVATQLYTLGLLALCIWQLHVMVGA